jgi:hypothetical protein
VPSVDRNEFLRIMRAFEQNGVEYVLIGATAMGLHGVVRATEDVDVMLRATADNFERLRVALRVTYHGDPNIDELRNEDWLGDYPVVRYLPPNSTLFLDLMTRLGQVATFENIDSEVKEFEGIRIRVATPRAIYRLKKDTLRAIDRQDAKMIADQFDVEEDS